MPQIDKNHDLKLPDWGPYSKDYAGTAHIPQVDSGLRFDLTVVPGHFRQAMVIPSERHAAGHHAWEAASDLSYYAYRYQIEWKDQVFCDVSYSALGDQARLIRCHCVNRTRLHQNLSLHLLASMNFPPLRPDVHGVLQTERCVRPARVSLPAGGLWVDALDYADLQFAQPRPTDQLVTDGWVRAEFRDHSLVGGGGVGQGFGRDAGDKIQFKFTLAEAIPNAACVFRYRMPDDCEVAFDLAGALAGASIRFGRGQGDAAGFCQARIPAGALRAGTHEVSLVSRGGSGIELDGFAMVPASEAGAVRFWQHEWTPKPETVKGADSRSLLLKYADCATWYGLAWDHPKAWLREFQTDQLDTQLRFMVPNNYTAAIDDGGSQHYTDVLLRPLELLPESALSHYALVCSGSHQEVEQALRQFAGTPDSARRSAFAAARARRLQAASLPSGERYRFSQERMAATEMLNVVYPVYTRRQFIRNFCPGKWWDSLYTWDAGFIGLALLEYDTQLSADTMEVYLTDAGDDHAAFVNHGSLIPTQIYQFQSLWNRTQDTDMLASCYPRLRQYYLFLAGRHKGSSTRSLKSGLIRTWEIFRWDSGGWDDYPAQVHTLEQNLDSRVACAAVTAHVIRAAKVLRAAALALGETGDLAGYDEDIKTLGDALQGIAWDQEAGYFSYVLHDESGNPEGPLRDQQGVNFNMGLDGVMPLFAGVCTPKQQALFMQRLADPKRFWTPIGLSTVDQSAPYYRSDGYWNGAVWMPHQWFIWKTALDLGHADFAYQIAHTALELWKAEVEASYRCCEHFLIKSGRGAGWHQFGALSSPVVSWFNAYHCPGRLSAGMDIWVQRQRFSKALDACHAELHFAGEPRTVTVIVNLQPGRQYAATWDGKPIAFHERHPGSLELQLPFSAAEGKLAVSARGN